MTTRVMFISPAVSTALREARFAMAADADEAAGGADGAGGARGAGTSGSAGTGFANTMSRGGGPIGGLTGGLTATGLAQAEAVRDTLPRAAAVYVSPSPRCRRTAEALGLDAEPLLSLAPCAMGRWQGMTLDEVAAAEPQSVAEWLSDPSAAPHGGESLLALHTRIGRWLDELSRHTPDARVIAVAEPDVVRAATVHALGASPVAFWRIDVRPLSLTELSGRDNRWNLLSGRPLYPLYPHDDLP
jgi:broad specificity phosphatase PhoE